MSVRVRRLFEINSVNGAVSLAAQPLMRWEGLRMAVQVLDAPASLVGVEGSETPDPAHFRTLTMQNPTATAAASSLGAGYYQILELPGWMRIVVASDASAPRAFRAIVIGDLVAG